MTISFSAPLFPNRHLRRSRQVCYAAASAAAAAVIASTAAAAAAAAPHQLFARSAMMMCVIRSINSINSAAAKRLGQVQSRALCRSVLDALLRLPGI